MTDYKAIIIGGSAGSFQIVSRILSEIPESFRIPIILCLHRLKSVNSGFVEALSINSVNTIVEPYDKEAIKPGLVYLAPSNYHLYINPDFHFNLSTEEPVNHSRPSINISFKSAAEAYKDKLIGIILSGANNDGSFGLNSIKENGGITIVQNPSEAQVQTMPLAAISATEIDHILSVEKIIEFIKKLQ